jgi:hypothetical protein
MSTLSPLQKARYAYKPKLPAVLQGDITAIDCKMGQPTESVSDQKDVKKLFTKTYGNPLVRFVKGHNKGAGFRVNMGVILSGGQAPGGHNVIAGIYDGLKKSNPGSWPNVFSDFNLPADFESLGKLDSLLKRLFINIMLATWPSLRD